MSDKAKTESATEEPVTIEVSGVPVQELELGSVGLAVEIIADLKKQLEEAKGNAKVWEENWNVCHDYNMVLSRQSDIISYILKLDNIRSLDMIWGCVRTSYEYQIKRSRRQKTMEKCKLTQVPCRKAIMDVVQTNKDRRSLQQTFELVKLFQMVVSDQASTLSEEDWERYFIIMKLGMIDNLRHLKCIDAFTNGLMK